MDNPPMVCKFLHHRLLPIIYYKITLFAKNHTQLTKYHLLWTGRYYQRVIFSI